MFQTTNQLYLCPFPSPSPFSSFPFACLCGEAEVEASTQKMSGQLLQAFGLLTLEACPAVKYYSSSELKAPVERAMDLVFSGERVILKLISLS
jgi:hypothetical protein